MFEGKKLCDNRHQGALRVDRVYAHGPSGQIGDVVGTCEACGGPRVVRDLYLGNVTFEDGITVFACTVEQGPQPTTAAGAITTHFDLKELSDGK